MFSTCSASSPALLTLSMGVEQQQEQSKPEPLEEQRETRRQFEEKFARDKDWRNYNAGHWSKVANGHSLTEARRRRDVGSGREERSDRRRFIFRLPPTLNTSKPQDNMSGREGSGRVKNRAPAAIQVSLSVHPHPPSSLNPSTSFVSVCEYR